MKDRGSNPRWRVFTFFSVPDDSLPPLPIRPSFYVWGCSSDGRAFALHARGTGIDTPHLHLFLFFIDSILHRYILPDIPTQKLIQKTTTAGFEPTLPKGNCLADNRLNHSATLSSTILSDWRLVVSNSHIPTDHTNLLQKIFEKTTVAGFEPTHPEDNWFQVNRLRPLGHTVLHTYPTLRPTRTGLHMIPACPGYYFA